MTFTEALRERVRDVVRDAGLRPAARTLGVDHAVLHRFLAGRDATGATLDRIVAGMNMQPIDDDETVRIDRLLGLR